MLLARAQLPFVQMAENTARFLEKENQSQSGKRQGSEQTTQKSRLENNHRVGMRPQGQGTHTAQQNRLAHHHRTAHAPLTHHQGQGSVNYGSLKDYYTAIGYKRLSATEVDLNTSHGHEFQGVNAFRDIFGTGRTEIHATIHYLTDDEDQQGITQSGTLKWYDSRENNPERSAEFRLYYPAELNLVQNHAEPGDLIIGAQKPDNSVDILIVQADSTWEQQLRWLFAIEEETGTGYQTRTIAEQGALDFSSQTIIERLGIELKLDDDHYLEDLLATFGNAFPTTRIFSDYARNTQPLDSKDDPDYALIVWLEREEMLFRTLEKHLISERLKQGFEDDVDAFISYSLSVQNRRKSRAGQSLENHLEQIFIDHNIQYSRGKITENRSKPDFLFPGIKEYHDDSYPASKLTMLGAKTTCKDRWRQVLPEAKRIKHKHLCTVEPGISEAQTNEMQHHDLQLVVPQPLHTTFTNSQSNWLLNLSGFIQRVND